MKGIGGHKEEAGHSNKLDPQDAWLPITESRHGNAYCSAFHALSSGIGVQALVLPLAFPTLGWTWGITCLCIAFSWQLYTLWLLIHLHESHPAGARHSRYLRLATAAFGEKVGKAVALLPIMYLSGGTCVTLIMIGGGAMKAFFQTVGEKGHALTTTEWYFLFTAIATLLAQLPNLNSMAAVSLLGALTGVAYCTLIWAVSVVQGKLLPLPPSPHQSLPARVFGVFNALGVIAFTFRGHNLVLEIQGTLPSDTDRPSHLAMWRGVKFAYLIIASCVLPLAIGGYWAYGNLVTMLPGNGGMLSALHKYHEHDTTKTMLACASLLVVINSVSSFQIYAMPVFDNLEVRYTSRKKRACPRRLRAALRVFFGCLAYFIAVALPFLPSLAGLLGGFALPVTLAYPCFMWLKMKKPSKYSTNWWLSWMLGVCGVVLSVLVIAGAIWGIAAHGINTNFFDPH
ncbi:lysine histidine transporter-like 8 [Neltuma alba]|uniref:lysine histidine transporter-like 8 n=1 Tax=Neltuma alba TaxID=207710 RepID=UPI0010A3CF83|nr:lysine histidine transporter-like 8 [Prosopis alba]XP_028796175.1 lysine histidine transporter-like 8 [Prosopis alba]